MKYEGVIERYTPDGYSLLASAIDPIEEVDGYSVKRGDRFAIGVHRGSKVRQCLHLVRESLERIVSAHASGICTAAGLPSPQPAIVAAAARYFGLRCAVSTVRHSKSTPVRNRINACLAAIEGADVYGVRNPNSSGPECDCTSLEKDLGYFRVKFGMAGDVAMAPVVRQCENIPDYIEDVVVIAGSGLTACGVLSGIAKHKKPVRRVFVVKLSNHFNRNKSRWHDAIDNIDRFSGDVIEVASEYAYQKHVASTPFDATYESKAWLWMKKNITPSNRVLFWVIGEKCYDQSLLCDIQWKTSRHEEELNRLREARSRCRA